MKQHWTLDPDITFLNHGNLHKWVCAPKGAAFLYVRENRRASVRPAIISHGANSLRRDRSRYLLEFDWTGTFDPSPWLCVPASLRFMASLLPGGWPSIVHRNHELALALLDRGVVVQPGYFFDFAQDGCLVVSLLTKEDVFAEGVRRIVLECGSDPAP